MSRPASPLLRPVSYQQDPETNNHPKPSASQNANKKARPEFGLPRLHTSFSSSTLNGDSSSLCFSPSTSEKSLRSEISFTHSDIETMNQVLVQARRRGELPCTTASPMDAQAVVEDYGYLTRLREARGNAAQPAPLTYKELRVEVTRRIKDRDSARDEEENRKEAVRRVRHYLNSIETEKQSFEEAASPSAIERTCSFQSDMESLGEKFFSVFAQAADQTMVDASEPLRFNVGQFRTQNSEYNKLLCHQQDLVRALSAMIDPQARAIQTSGENLALLTGIITHLSHFSMTLPYTVEQAVQRAVHEQTEVAIQQIIDAHQEAVLSLLQRRQGPAQSNDVINYDVLSASIVSKLQTAGCLHPERVLSARGRGGARGGLRRLWHRVKPSIMTI